MIKNQTVEIAIKIGISCTVYLLLKHGWFFEYYQFLKRKDNNSFDRIDNLEQWVCELSKFAVLMSIIGWWI